MVIKKFQKKCIYKKKIKNNDLFFMKGDYGICALENSIFTKEQLECCRILIKRDLKKKGSLLIKSNFNLPRTKKSTGVRMGKGKGVILDYINYINMYDCFFELKNVSFLLSMKLLKKLSYKLPFKICLIDKHNHIYKLNK